MDRGELLTEAKARYDAGTGPYTKDEALDQVDLVWFEELARHYAVYSDPRGLLSGCIDRLLQEVRDARGWPTPPEVEPMHTEIPP